MTKGKNTKKNKPSSTAKSLKADRINKIRKAVQKNAEEKAVKKIKSPMSKKELVFYKGLLRDLRKKIVDEIGSMEGDFLKKNPKEFSGDLSSYTFHMADMASDTYNTDFNLGLLSNETDILFEINEAMKRIDDGTYGVCEKYGIPISKSRLKAMPYTRYSIKAQEEEEKRRKRATKSLENM
ncbi:MAG: TraR/DksA C4-type zinc finger protein [Candidatus Omnitrophica bacterium]|nr:TraR/DksA C4-type zinc finger protein [Candidatus Omnitrophota bacterium]